MSKEFSPNDQEKTLLEKSIELTEEEKEAGWVIAYCSGNGYKRGCKKPYKTLNWHTPSGCPNCHATFVD